MGEEHGTDLDPASVRTLRVFGEWCVEFPWWPSDALGTDGEDWCGPLELPELAALGLSTELIARGAAWSAAWNEVADRDLNGETPDRAADARLDAEGREIALATSRELPGVRVLAPGGPIIVDGRLLSDGAVARAGRWLPGLGPRR